MVGAPRSHRCQQCKRQKIKCDENWPTCGNCVRRKVSCSGPGGPSGFVNFIKPKTTHDDVRDHTLNSAESAVTASLGFVTQDHTIMAIGSQGLPNGASFGYLRLLSSAKPKGNPTTIADRVATRLIRFIDHKDASWDMLTATGYTVHLPARLSESVVLRDCVALSCTAWSNFRRNLPADQIIDSKLYGKALRSLQYALSEPRNPSCETLAAVTVMGRLELLFDTGRPYHRQRHAHGIQGLMLKRGPPRLNDELDIQLAFENHATLISLWVTDGGHNFFLKSPWKEIMKVAVENCSSVPKERKDCYAIGHFFVYWPDLAHEFQSIACSPNAYSRQIRAWSFRDKVLALEAEMLAACEPIMCRLHSTLCVVEQPDLDSFIGTRYHFESLDAMQTFISYAMIRIIVNRIHYHLDCLQGRLDTQLDSEHRILCRQTWMCIPCIRDLGLVASILFAAPLYISYEGANEFEREYLLDFIIEMASWKGMYPKDRNAVEIFVLNTAKASTGRQHFDVTFNSRKEPD